MTRKWDEGYEGFEGFKDEIVPDNPESMDERPVEAQNVAFSVTGKKEVIDWHYEHCKYWPPERRSEYMAGIRELYASYPGREEWEEWFATTYKPVQTREAHTITWFDE